MSEYGAVADQRRRDLDQQRGQELDQRVVLADPLCSRLPGRWRVSLTCVSRPAVGVVGGEALEGGVLA
ncbi:hypothetical protein [Streptomyces sp. NPDC050287]|uniref:hypothetical protein n=1 Tax=Streptomyces sp. NPDC050287 TaxID=3365608 RepID=UPI00378EC2D1